MTEIYSRLQGLRRPNYATVSVSFCILRTRRQATQDVSPVSIFAEHRRSVATVPGQAAPASLLTGRHRTSCIDRFPGPETETSLYSVMAGELVKLRLLSKLFT
ncbi:hypothetical protein J6590_085309 [Homalodisca vitripennis]|nr:hypothetical protein J6590_085309 [Homalodisca vitripennis]